MIDPSDLHPVETSAAGFGRPANQVDYIVCPKCMELLTRSDVEGFGHCPYCDHPFELDSKMENFLLRPLISRWMQDTRPGG